MPKLYMGADKGDLGGLEFADEFVDSAWAAAWAGLSRPAPVAGSEGSVPGSAQCPDHASQPGDRDPAPAGRPRQPVAVVPDDRSRCGPSAMRAGVH
jgi:hypothetical protein